MEDMDQSPLVSSSSDSPPRPQPAFKYQFVKEPEDEEEEEEEEDEDEDEDLEELEVLERKPAAALSAAPVAAAAATPASAPLLDFGNDFVPPAPRGPLPAAPLAAPERQPSWDPSPVSSSVPAPSPPSITADSLSKLSEDEGPPARPPPPPPADVSPQAEPSWTPAAPAPAAPPSTPAAPKRRGSSGSVGECRALRLAPPLVPLPLLCAAPKAWTLPFSPSGGGFVCRSLGEGAPAGGSRGEQGGAAEEARAYSLLSVWVSGSTCAPTAPGLFCLLSIPPGRGS